MPANDDFTVTPYDVTGDINYDQLLEQFGANALTNEQTAKFPDPVHPLVRRNVFYAERDVDFFLNAANGDNLHSIVTGRGPSGPMHIGHIFSFYFAKYLQDQTGTLVYIPVSDDEKHFLKNKPLDEISDYTHESS